MMKRAQLADLSNRKRGGWSAAMRKKRKKLGIVCAAVVLIFAVSLVVSGGGAQPSYYLLLDYSQELSSSITISKGSFTSSKLPSFGSCERSLAEHYLQLDYGYERRQLQGAQAYRDRDLLDYKVVDIFHSSGGKRKTHRWAGNHFATDYILEFARQVIQPFQAEWGAFPNSKAEAKNADVDYYRGNNMHEGTDPIVLHSFVRALKPARVLEIGSGFSSRVTTGALLRNKIECGQEYDFVAIDPEAFRMAKVNGTVIGPKFHESYIEEERMAFIIDEYLQAGDLFFIDSSHAVGNSFDGNGNKFFFTDCMVEYSEILPRLPPGVFVHVHDIAFPDHYWFYERNWAELFVLRAFLTNNPYFDIVWSGGSLNMPWAELEEHPETMSLEQVRQKVESVHQAAIEAVGPHLHVKEVGAKRPFAGGGSIWLRRNMRPYPKTDTIPKDKTMMDFLKNPKRNLAGVDLDQKQIPVLRNLATKYKNHPACATNSRVSDCVVCAVLSESSGTVHEYDQTRLATLCPKNAGGDTLITHKRDEMLNSPLKSFTSLKGGDSIVLSNAHILDYKRNDAESLASILFILEIAPRLSSGINIVLYGGLIRDVSDLVTNQQGRHVGTFLTQAWLTMNDAVDILWHEDSDGAHAAGFGGNPNLPSDHVVIVRTR
eukprot:scaffold1033_cov171-Amphora_coffeaeformis.AAC.26